jgi:hypothetical protein
MNSLVLPVDQGHDKRDIMYQNVPITYTVWSDNALYYIGLLQRKFLHILPHNIGNITFSE